MIYEMEIIIIFNHKLCRKKGGKKLFVNIFGSVYFKNDLVENRGKRK